jgi:thioredoxin reductase (NADPH)
VVLAMGVAYRRLGIETLEALSGAGVFYGGAVTEAEAMTDERVFVVGGGNSAGQAAVHLARFAQHVTLLVRGPSLADSMSDYLSRELGTALFVFIGAAPRADWLPDEIARGRWGYLLTGNDLRGNHASPDGWVLERPPLPLETSMPGVFSVGDVRHASVKRVAFAVGEGSVSVRMVHDYLAGQ